MFLIKLAKFLKRLCLLKGKNNNGFTLQYTFDIILETSILGETERVDEVGNNGGEGVAEMVSGREKAFLLLFFLFICYFGINIKIS